MPKQLQFWGGVLALVIAGLAAIVFCAFGGMIIPGFHDIATAPSGLLSYGWGLVQILAGLFVTVLIIVVYALLGSIWGEAMTEN